MEKTVETTSPYANGYIIEYDNGTQTLERDEDPTQFYNTAAGGSYYTTKQGEELDELAQRFYGDFKQWHIIYASNINNIDDPIEPLPNGLVLYIPNPGQFNNM